MVELIAYGWWLRDMVVLPMTVLYKAAFTLVNPSLQTELFAVPVAGQGLSAFQSLAAVSAPSRD